MTNNCGKGMLLKFEKYSTMMYMVCITVSLRGGGGFMSNKKTNVTNVLMVLGENIIHVCVPFSTSYSQALSTTIIWQIIMLENIRV